MKSHTLEERIRDETALTAIHDTLRLVWSRELSADDGLDEIEILISPAKADGHITVHEYTAGSALEALKFYTEWMQRHACGDPEPIEHHYAMQAIDELEALLSKQEVGQ